MGNGLKIIVGLMGIPLMILGLGAMFAPAEMLEKLAVIPQGLHGYSTIRGDIGGLLVGSASMVFIGLWRNNSTWFLAVAVMMCTVALGRLVGFAAEGIDSTVIPPFVVELVISAVMITAHKKSQIN